MGGESRSAINWGVEEEEVLEEDPRDAGHPGGDQVGGVPGDDPVAVGHLGDQVGDVPGDTWGSGGWTGALRGESPGQGHPEGGRCLKV